MEDVVLEVNGLATGGNPSVAPTGSLRKAENCMIVRPGCIEQRPGFARAADLDAEVASNYVFSIIDYNQEYTDGQLFFYGTSVIFGTKAYIWGDGTTITDTDSILTPPAYLLADPFGVTERKNLYLPSRKAGLAKFTSPGASAPVRVGSFPLPDGAAGALMSATMQNYTDYNWLATGRTVAYKVVVRRTDVNGVIYRSTPSFDGLAATNSAGADRTPQITVQVGASDIRIYDVIELYRTPSGVLTNPTDYSELGEEYYLAGEYQYQSGTSVVIRDNTPDDGLGLTMYTSPSQEGVEAGNWVPPSGTTGALYKNCLWLGDLNYPPLQTLVCNWFNGVATTTVPPGAFQMVLDVGCSTTASSNIVTVTSTNNLHTGMYLTNGSTPDVFTTTQPNFPAGAVQITSIIDGTHITVSQTANSTGAAAYAFRDYALFTVNTVSQILYASRTDVTGQLLVGTLNNSTPTYVGTAAPGIIRILNTTSVNSPFRASYVEDKDGGFDSATVSVWLTDGSSDTWQQPFVFTTSAPEAFQGMESSGGIPTKRSVDHIGKAKIAWSKPDEPEHFTLFNNASLGDADARVLRIINLEDSLIVFKEDGVYRVQGTYPGWYIDTIDAETRLCLPQAACVLDNVCYAWTNRGVVAITEFDIQLVSIPALAPETVALGGTSADLIYAARSYTQGITVGKGSYAVAIPHRGLVCFAVSSDRTDAQSDVWWVYNPAMNAWTTWQLTARCATYKESEALLMIEAGGKSSRTFEVRQEKYSLTGPDTYDDAHALGNLTATTSIVISTSATDGWIPAVGDLVYGTAYAYVTAVVEGGGSYTISLSRSIAASASAVVAYESIPVKVRWNQQGIRGPFSPSMWREFETQWFDLQQVADVAPKYTARYYGVGNSVSSDLTSNWSGRSGGVPVIQSGIGQSVIDRISVHRSVARSPVIAPELEFSLPLTRWRLGASMLNGAKGNTARGVRR